MEGGGKKGSPGATSSLPQRVRNQTVTLSVTTTGHQGTITCNIALVTTGNVNANELRIFSSDATLIKYPGLIAFSFLPNINLPIRTKIAESLSCKKF